jgi:hypothetical protein
MTTAQTTGTPTIDGAFEQAKELNGQLLDVARKLGNLYLDSYEKAVDRAIELERDVAGATQQEWLKDLIGAQAELTRELTESYTSTARGLLK